MRGILRTIPQEREYPDPRPLPAQPSWHQPRPQLTLSELIPGKYVSATARIVYLKTSERHDAPNFIKEFQTELLYRLFDCKDSAEVISKGYDNALLLVTKTIDKVMTSEIPLKDLVVSKMLRQDLTQYRSLFPHVSAALQLTEAGKSLIRGDIIQYIYTDAAHKNPLRRVMPIDLLSEEPDYDKEKYREMLLEAAESILGYFDFDRTVYGDRKKNRKWWYQLREERRKDTEAERIVHDG